MCERVARVRGRKNSTEIHRGPGSTRLSTDVELGDERGNRTRIQGNRNVDNGFSCRGVVWIDSDASGYDRNAQLLMLMISRAAVVKL